MKNIAIMIFLLSCCIFSCDTTRNKEFDDDKYINAIHFIKNSNEIKSFLPKDERILGKIKLNVRSENIKPYIGSYLSEGIAQDIYQNESLNADSIQKIVHDSIRKLNIKLDDQFVYLFDKKRTKLSDSYWSNTYLYFYELHNGDLYAQILHNGYNHKFKEGRLLSHMGSSLIYYFKFNSEDEVIRCYKTWINYD